MLCQVGDCLMKNDICQKIINYFVTSGLGEPGCDDELFVNGFLDSFGMYDFIEFIEREFKIVMSPDAISVKNFKTITIVCELIETIIKEGK